MKVGVFLHDTAIMHAAAAGAIRQQRVEQVRRRDPSVADFGSYIPTLGTAAKLAAWRHQGAVIAYLSSHRRAEDLRADAAGRVWLFDPQRITGQPQAWWWNPLGGMTTVEAAHRMAAHFVLTVADGRQRDLWGPAAQELLCALFLAAASSGRSMRDVSRWLDETASPTPGELLDSAGFRALASSLRGAQHGAPETRDGIYQTARTAAARR